MNFLAQLLIAGSIIFSVSAQAGLLIEPYAGYLLSTLEGENKSDGETYKLKDDGLGFGGRLGYALPLGVWFAGDYLYQPDHKVTQDSPATTGDLKGARSALFLDVGIKVPELPLRFWAGYGFTNNFDFKADTTTTTYSGNAVKFGAGFEPLPFLSLNVEYLIHMFTRVKTASTDVDINDAYDNWKASTLMVTLSAPINLGGK